MYHEILSGGQVPSRPGPGYARYVIRDGLFRQHLEAILDAGAVGVSVTDALRGAGSGAPLVALTFDDGCESDLAVAAPLLREVGFGATFFITVGHVDTPGFLSRTQLAELAASGFEIGSHSMTHAYLSDLDDSALLDEIRLSRRILEDICDVPVVHLSCPGGRWDRRVASIAREAGYQSVADSRPVANGPAADPYRMGRFAIQSDTKPRHIDGIVRNQRIRSVRVRSLVLGTLRRVLGNRLYDRAREAMLSRSDAGAGPRQP